MNEKLNVHVDVTLTVNESDYSGWSDPKAQASVRFNLPVALFSSAKLTAFIDAKIEALVKDFPAAVAEWEIKEAERKAEKAAKEAAEKAEQEQGA